MASPGDTSATQSVVEFRANGTSGPFQLDLRGVTTASRSISSRAIATSQPLS